MSDAVVFDLHQMVCALHHLDTVRDVWTSQRLFHRSQMRAERATEIRKRHLPDYFNEARFIAAGRGWPGVIHESWLIQHQPVAGRVSRAVRIHPEDVLPGENIMEPAPGTSRKTNESAYTPLKVTQPIIVASFIDYSRLAGRGQVLLASWNGGLRPYSPEEEVIAQETRQLPDLCSAECARERAAGKIQEILTANGAEISERDYETLVTSTSQGDRILAEAIRTGHTWGLLRVNPDGTHLTDSGQLYNYAVTRLRGDKVPGRDREAAMSYDFRNAKINSFQQGGFSGSHTFNDNGSNQSQIEQVSDLIRLLLVEAPDLVQSATDVHTELRRAEQAGDSPDGGHVGNALNRITSGLSAGSAALTLAEGIRSSLGF